MAFRKRTAHCVNSSKASRGAGLSRHIGYSGSAYRCDPIESIDCANGRGLIEEIHEDICRSFPIYGCAVRGRSSQISNSSTLSIRGCYIPIIWCLEKSLLSIQEMIHQGESSRCYSHLCISLHSRRPVRGTRKIRQACNVIIVFENEREFIKEIWSDCV